MPQSELLIRVVRVLDKNGIPYMITGSVASSLQGEPRSTHDIDIVVALEAKSIKELIAAFPSPDFYLDEQSIVEALKTKGIFNLLDVSEGDNVDFWTLTDEPFDQSRFSRRITIEFMGERLMVSSPEDTILVKLKWTKLSGGSEKQFTDDLRVYEIQYPNLDMNYLGRWVNELQVVDLWKRLKTEAEVL